MSALQKASVLPASQGVFELTTLPIPKPASGQLLAKIAASALNPSDWKTHALGFWKSDSYPFIGGFDGAGTVEDVGSDVAGFTKGDHVLVQGWKEEESDAFHGTFQQYAAFPTYVTAKIPKSIPFEEAAPLFSCIATVAVSLYSKKPDGSSSLKLTAPWEDKGQGAYSGKSVFIPGGATNVGQFAIQFAKLSGFSPIITTASLRNQNLLTGFGATHIIDRTLPSEKIIEEVQAIANGPVDLAYDAMSEEETLKISGAVLRTGGSLVVTLPGRDGLIKDVIEEKKLQVASAMGIMTGPNRGALDDLWAVLPEWLEKGLIKPVPYEVLPGGLSAVPAGVERLRKGQVSAAKLVVLPQETA
ncbi:GroES-like protein [Dichomitus squalens]|nr:GroES-like protein [Dichomitus squalens]